MLYEFQIVVRDGDRVHHFPLHAETDEQALDLARSMYHDNIDVNVSGGRPLVDWSRGTFNTEESAEYLRCSPSKISELMATGKLPKARDGRPIFTRRILDKYIEEQRMAQPLEQAA
jgi:hypothetical protein